MNMIPKECDLVLAREKPLGKITGSFKCRILERMRRFGPWVSGEMLAGDAGPTRE